MSKEIKGFYQKEAQMVSDENASLGIDKKSSPEEIKEDLGRPVTFGEMLSVVDDISKDIATLSEKILETQILLRLLFENTQHVGSNIDGSIPQKDFLMSIVENYSELMMSSDVEKIVDTATMTGVSRKIATELFTGKLFSI